jgi:hypothetical protein
MAITFWRFTFNGITAYGNGAYDLVGGSDDITNLQALCFRCNAGQLWKARSSESPMPIR